MSKMGSLFLLPAKLTYLWIKLYKHSTLKIDNKDVNVNILDVIGGEDFQDLRKSIYKNTNYIIPIIRYFSNF